MFKGMYSSLQRAKQILIALIELLGLDDDDKEIDLGQGGLLGKRQRQ